MAQEENRPFKRRTRLEHITARTKCRACGKVVHWFIDKHELMKLMQEKLAEKSRQDRNNKDGEQNMKNTLFQMGPVINTDSSPILYSGAPTSTGRM